MKKLIAISAFIMLCAFGLTAHAERRPLSNHEKAAFSHVLDDWLAINWPHRKEDKYSVIHQKITNIAICCMDELNEGRIYIVDIVFHCRQYDLGRLIEDCDKTQRVLFTMKNGRISNFDPMPAYPLEMEG